MSQADTTRWSIRYGDGSGGRVEFNGRTAYERTVALLGQIREQYAPDTFVLIRSDRQPDGSWSPWQEQDD